MKITTLCKIISGYFSVWGIILFSSSMVFSQPPMPIMNPEPFFTVGDSNQISCEPAPGVTSWRFKWSPPNVTGDTLSRWAPFSYMAIRGLVCGEHYVFKAQASWPGDSSKWSGPVSSTQDCSPPATSIDSLDSQHEWATSDFYVYCTAIDSAGIDSVHLFYRQCEDTSWEILHGLGINYWDSCPVTAKDSILFPVDSVPNGCYEFFLGAKDCAKAPDWDSTDIRRVGNAHWPDIPDSVQATIKIDSYPPGSAIDDLDSIQHTLEFWIEFSAWDTAGPAFLSGVESVRLYWKWGNQNWQPDSFKFCSGDSICSDSLPFTAPDTGWYYFYTKAIDVAGNHQQDSTICSTYVTTQCLISFHMYDRDSPSREVYTNDTLVGAVCSLVIGTTEHQYDICFAIDPDSGCYYTWDSVYFNSVTRTIDSIIPLPNSTYDSKKIVYSQAQDLVNNSVSNWACDSITLDREPCSLESLILYDFQPWPHPPETAATREDSLRSAWPGWTDSVWIWAKPLSVSCSKAGPESLCFYGDISSSLYCIPYADSALLQLTNGEGPKACSCAVIDSAGNRSDSVSDTIIFDTIMIRPCIIDVPDTVTDIRVPIQFDTTFENLNPDLFIIAKWESCETCISETLLQHWRKPDTISIKPDTGWHWIFVSVRDSAGNWSDTARGSTFYAGKVPRLDSIRVQDSEPIDSMLRSALPGWTNDSCVWVLPFYTGNAPHSIIITDSNSTTGSIKGDTLSFKDTVTFCLAGPYLCHYISGQLLYGGDTSNTKYDTILYDSTSPQIGGLTLRDIDDENSVFVGYTDSSVIKTRWSDVRDSIGIHEIYISMDLKFDSTDSCFTAVESGSTNFNLGSNLSDGRKPVYFTVRDSAGNYADTSDSIYLDTSPPDLVKIDSLCQIFDDTICIRIYWSVVGDSGVGVEKYGIYRDDSFLAYTDTTCYEDIGPFKNMEWYAYLVSSVDYFGHDTIAPPDSIQYAEYPIIKKEPLYSPGDTNRICWDKLAQAINYHAQCSSDSSFIDTLTVDIFTDDICATFTDLRDGTTYFYRVRAFFGTGGSTGWSKKVHSTQDATPPQLDSMWVIADGEWVYDRDIEIRLIAHDTPPGSVYGCKITEHCSDCREINTTIHFPPNTSIDTTVSYYLTCPTKTPIEISSYVFDGADNQSNTQLDTILLDTVEEKIAIFPNPFNPGKGEEAVIRLKETNHSTAKIYDVFGNLVRTLRKSQGTHNFVWDGRNDNGDVVANGGYICVVGKGKYKWKVAVRK